jgi:hypothetical protein
MKRLRDTDAHLNCFFI